MTKSVYDTDAFQERVNFAASYIAARRPTSRRFDTCFEMNDGDAVAAALVRRAAKRPYTKLATNLFDYIEKESAQKASADLGKNLTAEAARLRAEAKTRFEAFLEGRA